MIVRIGEAEVVRTMNILMMDSKLDTAILFILDSRITYLL